MKGKKKEVVKNRLKRLPKAAPCAIKCLCKVSGIFVVLNL